MTRLLCIRLRPARIEKAAIRADRSTIRFDPATLVEVADEVKMNAGAV
jgi:hypothetical protein